MPCMQARPYVSSSPATSTILLPDAPPLTRKPAAAGAPTSWGNQGIPSRRFSRTIYIPNRPSLSGHSSRSTSQSRSPLPPMSSHASFSEHNNPPPNNHRSSRIPVDDPARALATERLRLVIKPIAPARFEHDSPSIKLPEDELASADSMMDGQRGYQPSALTYLTCALPPAPRRYDGRQGYGRVPPLLPTYALTGASVVRFTTAEPTCAAHAWKHRMPQAQQGPANLRALCMCGSRCES
ncbi:hypothetical protein FB451DRAFT_1463572 [Mycena latifolia]|nr:hypothetical protein FB451DRAFT_1463572 [Mycena latifolia]